MNSKVKAQTLNLILDAMEKKDNAWLSVTGASMYPFLRPGDRLRIESVPLQQLVPGDIVVYENNSKICSHRVIKKHTDGEKNCLLTKGDANLFLDGSLTGLSEKAIVGRVTAICRGEYLMSCRNKFWRTASRMILCLSRFTGRVHAFAGEESRSLPIRQETVLLAARIIRKFTVGVAWMLVKCGSLGREV